MEYLFLTVISVRISTLSLIFFSGWAVTNHCNPFIYYFVKTIQQCVDKTRKKLHNKKNVYIIVSQKISNKLKE